MIHRSHHPKGNNSHDAISQFIESLERGIQAISDPVVEAKVRDYFAENPSFSMDMVHVAAVACRFATETPQAVQVETPKRLACSI